MSKTFTDEEVETIKSAMSFGYDAIKSAGWTRSQARDLKACEEALAILDRPQPSVAPVSARDVLLELREWLDEKVENDIWLWPHTALRIQNKIDQLIKERGL